jgi:hypothetical protein
VSSGYETAPQQQAPPRPHSAAALGARPPWDGTTSVPRPPGHNAARLLRHSFASRARTAAAAAGA